MFTHSDYCNYKPNIVNESKVIFQFFVSLKKNFFSDFWKQIESVINRWVLSSLRKLVGWNAVWKSGCHHGPIPQQGTILFLILCVHYFFQTGQEYIHGFIFIKSDRNIFEVLFLSNWTGIYLWLYFFRDQTGIYSLFLFYQTGQEYILGFIFIRLDRNIFAVVKYSILFKLVQAASLIDGREASGSDVAVDAYLSLARYADGQYQNIVDYMKSPTYEAKQSLMQQARLETEKMRLIGQTSRWNKISFKKFKWEILFIDNPWSLWWTGIYEDHRFEFWLFCLTHNLGPVKMTVFIWTM